MRRQLKGRRGLYIGRVYTATADRLEMEYINGVDLADVPTSTPGMSRKIRRLLHQMLRMLLEDNRFHGDLHPRNIRLMPDGRLALLDHGAIGVTEADFLRKFAQFMTALATAEWKWAANHFMALMSGVLPLTSIGRLLKAKQLARVEAGLVAVLRQWATRTHVAALPFADRSLNTLTQRLVLTAARLGGAVMTVGWLEIQRALQALESVIARFAPAIDYVREARRYLQKAAARNPKAWKTQIADLLDLGTTYLDALTNEGVRLNL